jgi:hypothetical protein
MVLLRVCRGVSRICGVRPADLKMSKKSEQEAIIMSTMNSKIVPYEHVDMELAE